MQHELRMQRAASAGLGLLNEWLAALDEATLKLPLSAFDLEKLTPPQREGFLEYLNELRAAKGLPPMTLSYGVQ
jgi:hypothetical protein